MGNKLEQLLNSLIKRWRIPFWEWCHRSPYKRVSIHKNYNKERTYVLFYSNNHDHWKVLRQVVSKESWLWQFVCENGMINVNETEVFYFWLKRKWTLDRGYYYLSEASEDIRTNNYEYRVIESALKDESELESFILDNIKV